MSISTITVVNPLGLHARPAAKLVDCAARFTSDIRLVHGTQDIDAKSIMSVLMLAAPCGAELTLTVTATVTAIMTPTMITTVAATMTAM